MSIGVMVAQEILILLVMVRIHNRQLNFHYIKYNDFIYSINNNYLYNKYKYIDIIIYRILFYTYIGFINTNIFY